MKKGDANWCRLFYFQWGSFDCAQRPGYKMKTNLPEFFRKNVTLVNAIDDSGYCMIYSFSPAIKTRNPNEYIIQISSYSFELDTDSVLLLEFVGNQIEIKEELLMEMVWF